MSDKNFIRFRWLSNWYYHGFERKGQRSPMRRVVHRSIMQDSEKTELRDAFHKLSHDIRSPLTSILGLAEITLDDASLSEDARENLSMIVADAERLTEMAIKAIDEIDIKFFSDTKGE